MIIHSTAIVEPGAKIGEGVEIGPWSYIGADVEIGAYCKIGPRVTIFSYTRLGEKCEVHNGAVIGDTPQDYSFVEKPSYVKIGAQCIIREYVTIHRGTKPETVTEIGDRCMLMANVHVAHNVRIGNGVILANGCCLGGYAVLGDKAFLSAQVLIHQFARVGKMAMLSGSSGFTKDFPPFCIGMGRNGIVGLNVVGLRRAGVTTAERLEIRKAFKRLFCSESSFAQSLEQLHQESTSVYVQEMVQFIRESKRGLAVYKKNREHRGDDEDDTDEQRT